MNRNTKIAKAFSHAASTYDQYALIQRYAAERLAQKILQHCGKFHERVLEIGCGTGFLTEKLCLKSKQYIFSDISHTMILYAQKKNPQSCIYPIILDGETPCFTACFDIIVSNLALHWFSNPKKAIQQLSGCLKPGGILYFTCMGKQSFYEWKTAHILENSPCGTPDFISFGELQSWFPLAGTRSIEEEWYTFNPENSLTFLKSLKKTGSHLSHPGHKPLSYSSFKQVMKTFDKSPKFSYQILFGFYQKPDKLREE